MIKTLLIEVLYWKKLIRPYTIKCCNSNSPNIWFYVTLSHNQNKLCSISLPNGNEIVLPWTNTMFSKVSEHNWINLNSSYNVYRLRISQLLFYTWFPVLCCYFLVLTSIVFVKGRFTNIIQEVQIMQTITELSKEMKNDES